MPNFCQNTLDVIGDPVMVQEFHRRFTMYGCDVVPFSFHGFVQPPRTLAGCIDAWGTKWDVCFGSVIGEGEDYKVYYFETAWSPPVPVVHAMQREFPELIISMTYREEGIGFTGEVDNEGTDTTEYMY